MNITLSPSALKGTVQIPASKSFAHRQLIAAALADAPTTLYVNTFSKDIEATLHCISRLGAKASALADGKGYSIQPIQEAPKEAALFCNESGSTLRFMLPVAAVLGICATFTGTGRLPQRPNAPLLEAMRLHGVTASNDFLPIQLAGKLTGGLYEIAGNISSQYITGLLLSLPLCEEDSEIRFTTALESAAYLDITLHVLQQFGIRVDRLEKGFFVPGKQRYHSPGTITTEGDWSSAVFWHCANQMGHAVGMEGLNEFSCQGDRLVLEQLKRLGNEIDVSQTPDSLPALAVAACTVNAATHFTGAGRLRMKESDRLTAVALMLTALGQQVTEEPEGLIIHGGRPFTGGTVDGCNDHRIVMAAALAASCASGNVNILGAEAVQKSYPHFFEDYQQLGGKVHG